MLALLLAVVQLHSVSAYTIPELDTAVNNEIQAIEAYLKPSQQLVVKDVKINVFSHGLTSYRYWASILVEKIDKK